jgi:hypothetical protein
LQLRLLHVLLASLVVWALPAWSQKTLSETTHSPHGSLSISCKECHTVSGWTPIRTNLEFNHSKTHFPLEGMHARLVACPECHVSRVFRNVGSRCADCHADIHRRKNTALCEACHSVTGWQVLMPAINQHQDRFPLIGAHAIVDCGSCHKAGALAKTNRLGLSTECVSCHMNAFQKATNPNHQAMAFSINCLQCHTNMDSWAGAIMPGIVSGRVTPPKRVGQVRR